MHPYYTIQPSDVGKDSIFAFGRTRSLVDTLGEVLPGDVGKRIYMIRQSVFADCFLQVENNQQRDSRLGYYIIQPSDVGRYSILAFGQRWAVDTWQGKVNPAHVGKQVTRFIDNLGRECLQVEGVPGRAGRFTVVYENQSKD